MYYIDGNNLEGVVSRADVGSAQAESAVTQLVARWASAGQHNKQVTLVFDGVRRDAAVVRSGISVVFPRPQDKNADNTIIRLLKLDAQRANSIVVTTDAELSDRARALGAKVIRCRDWVESLKSRETEETKPNTPTRGEVGDWEAFFHLPPGLADKQLHPAPIKPAQSRFQKKRK